MLPSEDWARNFTVDDEDVEQLVSLLLDKETPLTSHELAYMLVEQRLADEQAALEKRFQNTHPYNPSESYDVGTRIVFPALDFAIGEVMGVREGDNPDYGDFKVLQVTMDQDGEEREFAAEFKPAHKLSEMASNGANMLFGNQLTADEVMREAGEMIINKLEDALESSDTLLSVARQWFPRELILDPNEGHLNLAEAVLDMVGGGPLPTQEILEQMGGISDSSDMSLQVFSMNYFMKNDTRFDEVGPTGEVLWFLTRMEPEEVRKTPAALRYHPIEHDRGLLNDDALALEAEIGDELSPLDEIEAPEQGTLTLIYPHRRLGTLPLNARVRNIFPSAQRTKEIYITLVDAQDGEEYNGWVVPEKGYVYGLLPLYNKHTLPVGAYVTAKRTEDDDKILVDFNAHRMRSEWVRLLVPKGEQISFENTKRSIGADYDDLMILGIDDLQALDQLVASNHNQKRTLASLLRSVIPELGKLTPQGTAHVKTIYSAVNVVRRCPPGPIMATLNANPDFANVGGNYWMLAEE